MFTFIFNVFFCLASENFFFVRNNLRFFLLFQILFLLLFFFVFLFLIYHGSISVVSVGLLLLLSFYLPKQALIWTIFSPHLLRLWLLPLEVSRLIRLNSHRLIVSWTSFLSYLTVLYSSSMHAYNDVCFCKDTLFCRRFHLFSCFILHCFFKLFPSFYSF